MGNIEKDDNWLHRLGKVTPVYIIAIFAAVEGSLALLNDYDFLLQVVGVVIIVFAALFTFYFIEIRQEKVSLRPQIIVTGINSTLYVTLSCLQVLDVADPIVSNPLVAIVIILWTLIIPNVIPAEDLEIKFSALPQSANRQSTTTVTITNRTGKSINLVNLEYLGDWLTAAKALNVKHSATPQNPSADNVTLGVDEVAISDDITIPGLTTGLIRGGLHFIEIRYSLNGKNGWRKRSFRVR